MTKDPHRIDVHVGGRVRLRRMMLGMSQEKLGEKLGLTFQQVQKYEKGANRIGASRLYDISQVLGVPVQFFFEDLPEEMDAVDPAHGADASVHPVMSFVSSSEGLQLNTAFSQIQCDETRKRIVDLIKTLSSYESI